MNSAILPTVLNAGILFLIRWAMDDSVESVVFMAIKTLHSILVSEADEVLYEKYPSLNGSICCNVFLANCLGIQVLLKEVF